MKRLLASLAFTAVLALAPTQANALDLTAGVFPDDQLAAQSSSGNHFAVGGGHVGPPFHFAFSAHCAAANCFALTTTDISGYAVLSDLDLGEAQGHVCAYTHGSRLASFVIVVEKGSGLMGSFGSLILDVRDNGGEPPNGMVRDELVFAGGPSCSGPFTVLGSGPVTQGNIVVKP